MRMEARRAKTCRRQGLVNDSRPDKGMPRQLNYEWLGVTSSVFQRVGCLDEFSARSRRLSFLSCHAVHLCKVFNFHL